MKIGSLSSPISTALTASHQILGRNVYGHVEGDTEAVAHGLNSTESLEIVLKNESQFQHGHALLIDTTQRGIAT